MKLFLLSESLISLRNKEGVKIGCKVDRHNSFAKNLKNSLSKCDNFVFICNTPNESLYDFESARFIFEGLQKSGMPFKKMSLLNNKNKSQAKTLIEKADLIYLQGGKLGDQLEFLKDIKFSKLLENSSAVVVGKSAGAMNLGKEVYQYPEDDTEVKLERWLDGIGLYELVIIPHFNLDNGNEFNFCSFNLLEECYIPDSKGREFIALPQGSYILLDENKAELYGLAYKIKDGSLERICDDGKKCLLDGKRILLDKKNVKLVEEEKITDL